MNLFWRNRAKAGPAIGLSESQAEQLDLNWYLRKYPDVAAAGVDPVQHFLSVGRLEGRYPNEHAAEVASTAGRNCGRHHRGVFLDFMRVLYEAILERPISEAEFDQYFHGYKEKDDVVGVVLGIQNSDEAEAVRRGKHAAAKLAETSIRLVDADVTHIIAQAYRSSLGRPASFDEVSEKFHRVKQGEPLADVLHEIASHAEALSFARRRSATHSLEAFSNAMDIVYRNLLGRPISDAEADQYFRDYKDGEDLVETILRIDTSEEARAFARRRSAAHDRAAFSAAIEIIYGDLLGHPPSEAEIDRHFREHETGEGLASIILSIHSSEEARAVQSERQSAAGMAQRALSRHSRDIFSNGMQILYRSLLQRTASEFDVDWSFRDYEKGRDFLEVVLEIHASEERSNVQRSVSFSEWADGQFIQFLFEICAMRGATPWELSHYQVVLGNADRQQLLTALFRDAAQKLEANTADLKGGDPTIIGLFGQKRVITAGDWQARARELSSAKDMDGVPGRTFSRFLFTSTAAPLVSIITSLYKGGDYIRHFLDNITSQSIFRGHCELLIIDANSPESEFETIEKFCKRFPNISYKRFDYRLGIYDAWNVGVENARGAYCTNANLDDCRRRDSLELQASTLDALPIIDVVYQDVYYFFEKNLPFEEIERLGFKTKLPIVSRYNLMEFNSPHNAPMWRRSLHDEIGLFDPKYKAAGDFEFWIRCLIAGKAFFKLNEPHVGYFVNPQGLSTGPDTLSAVEWAAISKTYFRRIVSPNLTMDAATLEAKVDGILQERVKGDSRYDLAQRALRRLSEVSRTTAVGDRIS